MTDYVLSIDPGLSSGVALLSYEDESPAELVQAWQFGSGVAGFLKWFGQYTEDSPFFTGWTLPEMGDVGFYYDEAPTVIAEKFTARNTRGFSYTTASLEPLRGEGALIALGLMPDYGGSKTPQWRDPKYQYLVGGKDKADKKKRLHKFLKDSGFYVTGGMLGEPNADDARSAIGHGLAYIARELKHKPTFDLISSWEN